MISPLIKPGSEPHLYYARVYSDGIGHTFWAALLEKAFAKINPGYISIEAGI